MPPLNDPPSLDEEIQRILVTLGTAMLELKLELDENGLDDEARELAQHIREMSDLLSEKVAKLDDSPASNELRSVAAKVMSEVVPLERGLHRRTLN